MVYIHNSITYNCSQTIIASKTIGKYGTSSDICVPNILYNFFPDDFARFTVSAIAQPLRWIPMQIIRNNIR